MKSAHTLLLGLAALAVSAQNTTSHTTAAPSSTTASVNPCAALSASSVTYASQNPTATGVSFKPSDVYACLRDVPLNATAAQAQVAWLADFLQFQSTLAWLKNPPPAYQRPAVDLLGGLAAIGNKVTNGSYKNEYDFEADTFNLITSASDGHLNVQPLLIGGVVFTTTAALVSVSLDGVQLPKVYVLTDLQAKYKNGNSSYPLSAVCAINGQDVTQYLNMVGISSRNQDLDAAYNAVFYNPSTMQFGPQGPTGYFGADLGSNQNDSTTLTFENGTHVPLPVTAELVPPFNLTFQSGQQLYQQYLTPNGTVPQSPSSTKAPVSGYPSPLVAQEAGLVSGYFLNGTNNDTAVLSIPSFDTTADQGPQFQSVVQEFLALSKSAGKSQLIIDVRGNGGGTVTLAYDAFKQLFPNMTPFSATRIRDSNSSNAIGTEISGLKNNAASIAPAGYYSFFNYLIDLTKPDGPNYNSWNDIYGPVQSHGDQYSNLVSWDFANVTQDISAGGFVVSGYGNNTNIAPLPFAAQNITLLTDGACASTCGLFANLVIRQGQVKTVTAGGRPTNSSMAVIGAVQGAEFLSFDSLQAFASDAIHASKNSSEGSGANASSVGQLLQPLTSPAPVSVFPSALQPGLNFRDNIAQGDASLTPLQFTYMPADCRFFYMPADLLNVTNTWARVVQGVKAGGRGLCINGTMGNFSTSSSSSTAAAPSATSSPPVSGAARTAPFGWAAAAIIALAMAL